jgi:hypothetical protein
MCTDDDESTVGQSQNFSSPSRASSHHLQHGYDASKRRQCQTIIKCFHQSMQAQCRSCLYHHHLSSWLLFANRIPLEEKWKLMTSHTATLPATAAPPSIDNNRHDLMLLGETSCVAPAKIRHDLMPPHETRCITTTAGRHDLISRPNTSCVAPDLKVEGPSQCPIPPAARKLRRAWCLRP